MDVAGWGGGVAGGGGSGEGGGGVGGAEQAGDHEEVVVKEGWLLKRGEHIKNWRNR